MIFSKEELLFFNNVIKGPEPFGIFLAYPKGIDECQLEARITESLKEKGLIDEQGKLSRRGILILMLWESYCNCSHHLVINHALVSVQDNRRAVILRKKKDGYELYSTDSAVILESCLRMYPFLREKTESNERSTEQMPYDAWLNELRTYKDELLIIGDYRNYDMQKEIVYYWKDGKGFSYDINSGIRSTVTPRMMRLQLMGYLHVRKEESNG